jgi:hypothetical protein
MKDIIIFEGILHVFQEVALAMLPLIIIFFVFQIALIKMPWDRVKQILIGIFLSFLGVSLFLQGVQIGFLPTGSSIGEHIGKSDYSWVLIPLGLMLGFVITIAEPAVRVLNYEVEKVSGGYVSQRIMLYTLSIGVAVSVALAMIRIIYGIPLLYIVIPGYTIALILIRYSSPTFVSIAFDSGGAATGPMTVTFIMAMAVGVATGTEGRDPLLDGFGLVALVALAPILSVLLLGLLYGERRLDNENRHGTSINSDHRKKRLGGENR